MSIIWKRDEVWKNSNVGCGGMVNCYLQPKLLTNFCVHSQRGQTLVIHTPSSPLIQDPRCAHKKRHEINLPLTIASEECDGACCFVWCNHDSSWHISFIWPLGSTEPSLWMLVATENTSDKPGSLLSLAVYQEWHETLGDLEDKHVVSRNIQSEARPVIISPSELYTLSQMMMSQQKYLIWHMWFS